MELLQNETIRLRALEPEDLDLLYRWENDSQLWNKGNTLTPYSRYALKQYIAESHRDIFELKQMRLMIESKITGERMGMVDLYDFDPHNRKAAIGVLVDSSYQKKGIATQSVYLLIRYSFFFLKLHQLFAFVAIENKPSNALFTRCGFKETALLKDWIVQPEGYSDVILMQLLNKD